MYGQVQQEEYSGQGTGGYYPGTHPALYPPVYSTLLLHHRLYTACDSGRKPDSWRLILVKPAKVNKTAKVRIRIKPRK